MIIYLQKPTCLACRGLCSFSHPELKDDNGQMLVFRSISQLKRQLGDTKHVQLCNICVENRKVKLAIAAPSSLSLTIPLRKSPPRNAVCHVQ